MKRLFFIHLMLSTYLQVFSQQSPVKDTLIPKQHLDDTLQYEPKLEGGALIDTINTKNKNEYHPGFLIDSLGEKNRKDKPKEHRD